MLQRLLLLGVYYQVNSRLKWLCALPQALPDADIETRMSLLQRQMKIGDACTFRLIAKNVVSLLPASQDDLKEQTMTELENLIRCAR